MSQKIENLKEQAERAKKAPLHLKAQEVGACIDLLIEALLELEQGIEDIKKGGSNGISQ